MLYASNFNTSGHEPLTSYSKPNGILRLSFHHQPGQAQSQFTTPKTSRPVLLTNSFKQFQFSLHQVAHTGTYPRSKSACRYNAVTLSFLPACSPIYERTSIVMKSSRLRSSVLLRTDLKMKLEMIK